MTALVSIVVPIYNSEKWLTDNIESLLNQTYKNLEIILVNDGSSDRSGDICKSYAYTFKHIRYIKQTNAGASAARNAGIRAATGKYLLFVDSDDWVSKEHVLDLVTCLEKNNADFAVSGIIYETAHPYSLIPTINSVIRSSDSYYEDIIIENEKSTILYSPCSGIYQLELIKQNNIFFPEKIKYAEDRVFNWRYMTHCKSIAFTQKTNYHYRHENSHSLSKQRYQQSIEDTEFVFQENLKFYNSANFSTLGAKRLIYTKLLDSISNIILTYDNKSYQDFHLLIKSITNKPFINNMLRYADKKICPHFVIILIKIKISHLLTSAIILRQLISKKRLHHFHQRYYILTHPLKNNYGGCIQAYALVLALNKAGVTSTLFNYKQNKSSFNLYTAINIIKKVLLFFSKLESTSKYSPDFMYQKLSNLKDKNITYTTNINTKNPWIVGSDQVWRATYARQLHSVPFYTLNFLSPQLRKKSISYAASFGSDEWEGTPAETEECGRLLREFKAVSVRESSGIKICKEVFGVDAVQMPDPTLLLHTVDYGKIIDSEKTWQPKGRYVAAYVLDETAEKAELLQKGASALNLHLQHLMPHANAKKRRDRFPISVPQWLRLIRDCEYFVTDSFHGCVFAIIYNKPFVCLGNEGRGNARFDTLLGTFCLEDRLITDATPEKMTQVLNTPIDWERVNAIHDVERERGIKFLKENLTEL